MEDYLSSVGRIQKFDSLLPNLKHWAVVDGNGDEDNNDLSYAYIYNTNEESVNQIVCIKCVYRIQLYFHLQR